MERVCRVCLAEDVGTYRVARTALEQTYDAVTSVKLQRAGRPTALCCVCVSQLRRCRRFIETARESNAALDRWYRNRASTHSKLQERPLFPLTKTTAVLVDISEPQVKQEPADTEHAEDGFITDNIKQEVTRDDVQSEPTHVSHDDSDSTHASDGGKGDTQLSDDDGNVNTKECRGVKRNVSDIFYDVEWVNESEIVDGGSKTQASDDVKPDIPGVLDDVESETAPGTSNVGRNASQSFRKKIKLERDITDGPTLKQRRPITARHRPGNTDTASTPRLHRNMFSCSQCTYTTDIKTDIKRHYMRHSGEKPFSCDKCDYKCIQKSRLKRHLMSHTGEKPFACVQCDFKCSQKDNLKTHLKTHTGEKPFACDQCDSKFAQKGALKAHLMTHTGEKPFVCHKCAYKFSQKSSLKTHLLIHAGEKPLACDKCDYKCVRRGDLKIHLMTHTGEKPFACDKCDYKCRKINILKEHLMSHTGEKPFACDHCDYKFAQRSALKIHLISHTGQKPFACDKCNYKTIRKNHLKLHLMTHTGEKPFACDKCDYKCNRKGSLKLHLMRHI